MNLNEAIYIAGPECFYLNGTMQLKAMRSAVEAHGMTVTLPNDTPLDLTHEDLRLNADAIFRNCAESMNRSTGIICDLEFFRGPEPDGGSIYEIGMAFARGIRCYGYTRDKRDIRWKYQGYTLKDGIPYDRKNRILPNYRLPFSPNVIGAAKIVEGDFYDCLRCYLTDLEEERKHGMIKPFAPILQETTIRSERPIIYLAGPERYNPNAEDYFAELRAYCIQKGFEPISPYIPENPTVSSDGEDPYEKAYRIFLINQQNVRNADIILANLNDFHGWEPESDTSFECGMGFQLGKKLYGFMDETPFMRERIPNLGPEHEWRDLCGCNAENFNYPLNLMFASSMEIWCGNAFQAIDRIAEKIFQP